MKIIPHPEINPYEQVRKRTRWEYYDYTLSGMYFVTFCTQDRQCFFGDIVDGVMHYSNQGSLAEALLTLIPTFNPVVEVVDYVVMPDHIHILMAIHNDEADQRNFEHRNEVDAPIKVVQKNSLSSIIGNYKGSITRHCHRQNLPIEWQRGFYDHVVRNHEEMIGFQRYIDSNVPNWEVDRLKNPKGWAY